MNPTLENLLVEYDSRAEEFIARLPSGASQFSKDGLRWFSREEVEAAANST